MLFLMTLSVNSVLISVKIVFITTNRFCVNCFKMRVTLINPVRSDGALDRKFRKKTFWLWQYKKKKTIRKEYNASIKPDRIMISDYE